MDFCICPWNTSSKPVERINILRLKVKDIYINTQIKKPNPKTILCNPFYYLILIKWAFPPHFQHYLTWSWKELNRNLKPLLSDLDFNPLRQPGNSVGFCGKLKGMYQGFRGTLQLLLTKSVEVIWKLDPPD